MTNSLSRKKLRIAQVAPLWYPIPPKKYGGSERIVHLLTEALVQRGHHVTLFASGNSKTKARLASIYPRGLTEDNISWNDPHWELEHLSFSFNQARNFDIVHCHVGLMALFFQNFISAPTIHTLHSPLYGSSKNLSPAMAILDRHRKETMVCFISKSAKKISPIKIDHSWVVYNGIDTNLFKFNPNPKDYFIWAGRIENYKGVENAIQVAEKTKIKLYLVGKLDPERQNYFKEKIEPHLSKKIQYLGEKDQRELAHLLGEAKGFIYPIEWNEPFGLVMAEAQACGTPVIVFNVGSASELVQDKKTGFVVPPRNKAGEKNIKGLVDAIKNIESINRKDCRNWVEKHFTIEHMVNGYEKIYYEITKKN